MYVSEVLRIHLECQLWLEFEKGIIRGNPSREYQGCLLETLAQVVVGSGNAGRFTPFPTREPRPDLLSESQNYHTGLSPLLTSTILILTLTSPEISYRAHDVN